MVARGVDSNATQAAPARAIWPRGRHRAAIAAALWLANAIACSPSPEASTDVDAQVVDGAGGRLVDPLSMPATPTLKASDFRSAQDCKGCHPTHHQEWSTSRHAFAMVDPVFRVLVGLRQQHLATKEDAFCVQCHSAIGTRSGDIQPGFAFEDLAPITLEGVTCEACHKANEIVRTHNAGHKLDATGPLCGNLESPQTTSFHASVKTPHMGESRFCGTCHDVVESNGLPLERPFEEWQASPAATEGKPCQSCHMPTYDGVAALGGQQRKGLHRHRWIGVELPLGAGPPLDAATRATMEAEITALLQSAAKVHLELPAQPSPGKVLDVVVTVDNTIGAHSLPTGSTFLRQCWLELVVKDEAGKVVYVSGDFDSKGDLRDHWSEVEPYGDADLVSLSSKLIDLAGNPTPFTWRATEHHRFAIPAGHSRTYTYLVPMAKGAKGALAISARLRFRAYPPWLLRLLGLAPLIDEVPVHDLASAATAVDVAAP